MPGATTPVSGTEDGPTEDELAYSRHAATLASAVETALPAWVVRSVELRCDQAGRVVDDEVRSAAHVAAARCRDEVGPTVRELLLTDPDEQRSTPLALLRDATGYATRVLRDLEVPAVERDDFSVRAFPDDDYDLTPAGFGDVDPTLHEPGLVWGAAKAHIHLTRRRAEGKR